MPNNPFDAAKVRREFETISVENKGLSKDDPRRANNLIRLLELRAETRREQEALVLQLMSLADQSGWGSEH